MKNSVWWFTAAGICVAAVVVANVIRQDLDNKPVVGPSMVTLEDTVEERPPVETPSLAEALGVSEEDMIEIGGIKRPKRDVVNATVDSIKQREKYLAALPKIGSAPMIPNDHSETTRKLAADLANPKTAPAASSILAAIDSFDRDAFLADPTSWLEQTRPARVFHSLPAKKGVDPIEHSSPAYQEILQGESVIVEAKAEPGMPVTFHTQQLGEFDNRLKTISVAASDKGVATAKYTAVSGVIGSVRIMAASPVHSGNLVYLVEVSVPN